MSNIHGTDNPKIRRAAEVREVRRRLRAAPVVAILGGRRVGKTTLARDVARASRGRVHFFDLEDPRDVARMREPMRELEPLRGLVVLDEVQCLPDVFPVLRVLADRSRRPARFLVLGSAAPHLLRQSSESLAGRLSHHLLGGLALDEVGARKLDRLWLRGGYPESFTAADDRASFEWRHEFVRTFLDRDLAQFGLQLPAPTVRRFWAMLAHYHGQTWNSSEFARAFGVADHTVRRWLDFLTATFVVRQLPAWSENLGKRQVKAPKVYVADTGMLHALLGLADEDALLSHPKVGASWEAFALRAVTRRLGAHDDECWFWATQQGAELDLLVVRGGRRYGFEMKRTVAPEITKSMRIAMDDLRLERLAVIHAGERTFELGDRIRAVALKRVLLDLPPLRPA